MIRHLLAPAFVLLSLPTQAFSEGLTVNVDGIRNARGSIIIMVFDDARAFDNLDAWSAITYAQVPAKNGTIRHEFPGLCAGPYAVLLFHDENGDEDLNMTATQFLEGVGATGAPNPEDEPDFKAASVWPGDVRVRVHYDQ